MKNKAKEMFEKLGYEQFCYSSYIEYTIEENELNWKKVVFDLINKSFCADENYEAMYIDPKTFEAIHQQILELGWIENKPLKFNDLKEGIWVWDNFLEEYMSILLINNKNSIAFGRVGVMQPYELTFEENRFYEKEVK